MIRTMIVDDDGLVRLALSDILEDAPGIIVAAQVSDGREAVQQATVQRLDVVLMDVRMPHMDGIEATRRMSALPEPPKVVMLTTFDLDQYVYDGLAAGAVGFLLKDSDPAEIIRAVEVVADGQAMLHPSAARRLIAHHHHMAHGASAAARARMERLTPRETDVLRLLAGGASNAEIAAGLGMRESTVKAHVSRILAALEVGNRVQAALCAKDAGLMR
ncbi:response regulator transcription factor [Streptomyces lydicus]|uniref:response regulator transcription factor n=1 Tax=Streptomyces lydicus TaxID=47763 RepID=UPI001012B0E5|nr:response regulator transcription factor [Streptomyces lydicus]MCZ1008370.1 response regulator transcription factor [Streptomyces lydicus]